MAQHIVTQSKHSCPIKDQLASFSSGLCSKGDQIQPWSFEDSESYKRDKNTKLEQRRAQSPKKNKIQLKKTHKNLNIENYCMVWPLTQVGENVEFLKNQLILAPNYINIYAYQLYIIQVFLTVYIIWSLFQSKKLKTVFETLPVSMLTPTIRLE